MNDRLMAEVIRAGMFSRLKTLEMSGTNLASAPEMFAQIVLLLENGRRYAISPITKFLLSSTGLGEPHFRRILEAVQIMPRLMDPTGPWTQRPDVPGGGLGDALGVAECERIPDNHSGPFASSRSWIVWDICLRPFPLPSTPLSTPQHRC